MDAGRDAFGRKEGDFVMLSLRMVAAAATLGTAALAATPAQAADPLYPIIDPCGATWVNGGIACVGYVDGNLFQGGKGTTVGAGSEQLALINQLLSGTPNGTGSGLTTTAGYAPSYGTLTSATVLAALQGLNGTATLNFGGSGADLLGSSMLSGLTIVGLHFGNTPDANVPGTRGQPNTNVSAFWLVNLTSPTQTLSLTNGAGSSNAQVFATRIGAVPEPATWALMLLGFGGMGLAMRRSRRRELLQQMA